MKISPELSFYLPGVSLEGVLGAEWRKVGKRKYILIPVRKPSELLGILRSGIEAKYHGPSELDVLLRHLTPAQKETLIRRGRLKLPGSLLSPSTVRELYRCAVRRARENWWSSVCGRVALLSKLNSAHFKAPREKLLKEGLFTVMVWPGGWAWTIRYGGGGKSSFDFNSLPAER